MRKALLADDDFLVRSYLKMLSSWEKAGFEITADVRDGEEALEVLDREKIDLVVTDIAMPLMDGIELIREIRRKYPDIYVIVLSCHDEFEYVKKAMKEGADEYVLKNTLNEESLYTVLEAAEEHIRQSKEEAGVKDQKQQTQEHADMKKDPEEDNNADADGKTGEKSDQTGNMNEKFLFFNQILAGTLSGEEREEKRIRAGIRGKYKNSAVIVIKREETEYTEDPLEEARKEQYSLEFYRRMQEKLQSRPGESETEKEMIYLGNGTYCCFLDLSDEYKSSVMYQHLTGTASACYKICEEEEEAYKIGVSNICIGADALRQAYQQARMMIKNSFYEKDGIAYYEADRAMGKEPPKEAETLLEEAELLKKKSEKDKFLLMAGTVIQAFKKERCDSQLVRQWFRKLEHKLQVDGSRADQHFGYIGEVKKELEHLAEQAFECGEPNIPEDLSQAVKIAADYAARHYREAVGLGDAAEAAGVNSTYLSYLFSQEMGIGFANYLLNLRMEHAKKLLRETNLKMWQVAEESGFNDYHYFSKVFKKAEGMSPAQYRKHS
mgnify:FL=1